MLTGVALLRSVTSALSRVQINQQVLPVLSRGFHCSLNLNSKYDPDFPHGTVTKPTKWLKYNDVVYPPQKEGEPRRPAEVCHMKTHVKYSPDKLWYIAIMIRGMSIDEAIKQLSFNTHKGAGFIKQTLLEAQEMAVRDHNVEYKSNLWIEDSFVGKGKVIHSRRKHARKNYGLVSHKYSHYFVRVREGQPPKHYYPPEPTGHEKMEEYIQEQRSRRILRDL